MHGCSCPHMGFAGFLSYECPLVDTKKSLRALKLSISKPWDYAMTEKTRYRQAGTGSPSPSPTQASAAEDLKQQRLRILRCTARAMAASPGGLRFKAGSRVWLEGLS